MNDEAETREELLDENKGVTRFSGNPLIIMELAMGFGRCATC